MSVNTSGSIQSPSAAPTRKVTAGGLAGALTVILIWVLSAGFKVNIPPEVASAITVVFSFIVSYFVPPAASDVVVAPATAGVPTGAPH